MKTTQERINLINEYHNGKPIQFRLKGNPVWHNLNNPPNWDFKFYEYRVKPEDAEENTMKNPLEELKEKLESLNKTMELSFQFAQVNEEMCDLMGKRDYSCALLYLMIDILLDPEEKGVRKLSDEENTKFANKLEKLVSKLYESIK